MRKQLLLILVGTLLTSQVARAGEPAATRKVASRKASTTKKKSDAPRLFRDTIVMAQAIVPPPAPAAESGPTPVPGAPTIEARPAAMEPMPQSVPMETMPMASNAVQLYDCVKYKDLDNVHPCAVTKIVAVADPCQDPCDCCGPRCVYVQICVPPCDCPEVKTSHGGRKVKYMYGKYQVEIRSKKNGVVEVDYDHHLLHF